MLAEIIRTRPKVLMIGAHHLVLDNVRVLLRTMECHFVAALSVKEGLKLLQREKPDAVVFDIERLVSSTPEIVAALHKVVLRLPGRVILLTRGDGDSQLRKVLDAYSLPKVPVDLVFQQLWPCLHLSLAKKIAPRLAWSNARLVFDSFLQPAVAGSRSAQPAEHRLLYESGDVMLDLCLTPQRDSCRIQLMGQILDRANPESQLHCAPVVLQSEGEPIEVATTNALGEFLFDLAPIPDLTLEIGVNENHWISVPLSDSNGAIGQIKREFHSPETAVDTEFQAGSFSRKEKGGNP